MIETRKLPSGRILTYDTEAHKYAIEDRPVPGTHKLMRRHGILEETPPPWVDFSRGNRVHIGCHYDAEGDLDEASVRPEDLPAILTARKIRKQLEIAVEGAELLNGSDQWWYATKSDIVGFAGAARIVANYKTGGPEPWHAIQLHLEALLVEPAPVKLLGIYLDLDRVEDYFRDREAAKVARLIATAQGEAFAWRIRHAT